MMVPNVLPYRSLSDTSFCCSLEDLKNANICEQCKDIIPSHL